MTQENKFLPLNATEEFLRNFLEKFPFYKTQIINPLVNEQEYLYLLHLLEREWNRKNPDKPFFLTGSSEHLSEDFFIPEYKNVCILKNLRYMPLLMHSHQFIEIDYVLKSDNSLLIDSDKSILLQDGDIILCPPNLQHTFQAQNKNSIIVDLILRITTFDTVFFQLLNNNNYLATLFSNVIYGDSNGYIVWHCKNDPALKQLLLKVWDEWERKAKYYDKMIELLIMEFIITLMRSYENKAIFSASYINNSDENFRALLNYMQVHYQTVTLSKLTMAFNYSERQIIRILKKNTEKGFSELLLDIRMNKAIQLLKNNEIPVNNIASMLGYSTTYYFNKVFLETFTFTPESFRKRIIRIKES